MAHCFVTRELPGPALDRLRQKHDVDTWTERLPPSHDELVRRAADAEGLLTLLTDRLDANTLDELPHLRAISSYAVGVDNIDLAAASSRGIPVGHTPDVLTDATADLAFTLLLAAARRLPEAMAAAQTGDWVTWEPGRLLGQGVYGATLGIIGYGRIGRAVAARAKGFEMRILHTSTTAPDRLEQLLAEADFVSLHCPLTPETHHLIDRDALGKMKPTAILVNTARGPIVDQKALIEALHNGTIAGAGLDVTDPEPPQDDDPILSAPRLVLTPHVGSATRAAREKMADMAVDNLLAGLEGGPMPHQANSP